MRFVAWKRSAFADRRIHVVAPFVLLAGGPARDGRGGWLQKDALRLFVFFEDN
ncbi:hypothetical protein [Azospirillum brasilense]|uniref:hypothetical protein n=1 Tax=Azospirillum brasilense TaxID=192 RepID=UPI0016445BE8|nr:hypothetical protein [Azospirillum brasilense]